MNESGRVTLMSHVTDTVTQRVQAVLEQNLKRSCCALPRPAAVDNGKSTLIGRLLHDSKTVYEDQLASSRKPHHRPPAR